MANYATTGNQYTSIHYSDKYDVPFQNNGLTLTLYVVLVVVCTECNCYIVLSNTHLTDMPAEWMEQWKSEECSMVLL